MTGLALAGALTGLGRNEALLLAAILAATFVLEDAAVVAAALLASRGWVDPAAAIVALALGIALGDLGLHFAGRWLRRNGWVARQCARPGFARAARWIARRRWQALIFARFVPGMRLPAYLASGILNFPLAPCCIVIAAGAALWTPALFLASLTGWGLVTKPAGLLLLGIVLIATAICRTAWRADLAR